MLTTKMLMNRLNIGRDTAYSLMRARNFPSIKLGRRYYVDEDSLKHWLTQQEKKKQ